MTAGRGKAAYRGGVRRLRVPLVPTGRTGEYVAGVRFKAWALASGLHPTLAVDAPLTFDLIDTWTRRSLRLSRRAYSPRSPPLAPPAPQSMARPCSPASQLLRQGPTSRARASSATAPHLPDADRRLNANGQTRDLPGSDAARKNSGTAGGMTMAMRWTPRSRPTRSWRGRAFAAARAS